MCLLTKHDAFLCIFFLKGETMKKGLLNLATLSLLGFMAVACNDGGGSDRYAEGLAAGQQQGYTQGYDVGYDDGYDDGYVDGDAAGYERAKSYFASADYLKGFADGKVVGVSEGYANGYTVGKNDGAAQGYTNGYNAGYDDGDADGYDRGYDNGYDDGYDDGGSSNAGAYNQGYAAGEVAGYNNGYDDGAYDGYDLGYDDGFDDGYDIGYDDGWYDGSWGLSVGKAKKLQGYSNLLSMVHNDLFDYSKVKAPKQTKKGLVANGKLILSETSLTNKDTLKRAAAAEQYLVVEMAKQVKGKFGLSAERSLKVAKAANHFRKFSTKRALTAEDTNAYATEIIGSNFSQISKAYEAGMKGDLGQFNTVMEKAAAKNETSPEKMAAIVTKFFM
jgi:flagellar biosynthesis/type III secretory pathway protein FliH